MNYQTKGIASHYSKNLWETYSLYRIPDFQGPRFPPEVLHQVITELQKLLQAPSRIFPAGKSFEKRDISCIRCGSGPIQVLLWSQMHGDEPTATMAICDIINYIARISEAEATKSILTALTLHFVPMLNPDGAVRFQRRNAQNIDINRDALALRTQEAALLKKMQTDLKPHFAFNLHDQELSTVGNNRVISTMSLLAPAYDSERSDNAVRTKAKQIASVFNDILQLYIPGRISKYDDSFEPRAFGDNMQKSGTSTLLVESGHIENDPKKEMIRKLNFVGIISALISIANSEYQSINTDQYEKLPPTGKRAYDLIIRNATIDHDGRGKTTADLAVSYQVDTHSESPPKLVDAGDLHPFTGLKEIDAKGKMVPSSALKMTEAFDWEKYFL